jgi:hypothetical protein
VHPSPVGTSVVVVTGAEGGGTVVRALDAATGFESWQRRAEGVPGVAWSPAGDEVLLSERDQWRFVSADTGDVREVVERPGDAPAWCCPGLGVPHEDFGQGG